MALIFILSGTPAPQVDGVENSFQALINQFIPALGAIQIRWLKVGHIIGYAALGLAFRRGFAPSRAHPSLWAIAAVLVFAVSDELHQGFIPGRSGSFSDVALDILAAASILIIRQAIHRIVRR